MPLNNNFIKIQALHVEYNFKFGKKLLAST